MKSFNYTRAENAARATDTVSANAEAKFIAGGTNILDLMKEGVENPSALVDVSRLSALAQIKSTDAGGVSIGALARNSDTANHPIVRQNFPLLSQAILAGASAQLRNMATNGGNLLQRTRCQYFYETAMPCNKRQPGTGCGALEGVNRIHAVFGWSEKCIAVMPSDMCVALAALDAVVKVRGANDKTRSIPFSDFHRLPGDAPEKDNNLAHGELIESIELPRNNFAAKSYYLKVRDRASYAFALVSVAAAIEMDGGKIKQARVALGGVAHKPWRALEAEKFLAGKGANADAFRQAAEAEMKNARGFKYNSFKIELGRRAIVRALEQATNGGAKV